LIFASNGQNSRDKFAVESSQKTLAGPARFEHTFFRQNSGLLGQTAAADTAGSWGIRAH
jgi:hypothetical protein